MALEVLSLLAVLTLGLLTPGPDFLLVLKNSVGGSRRRAFGTVAGVTAGLLAQMTAITIGFTTLIPDVLRAVQLAGAAVLAWIGVRTLIAARCEPSQTADSSIASDGAMSSFVEGIACNLTNPKAFVFYVSMFAQVLTPDAKALWRVLLPLVFVVHGAVAWTLVVFAVQSAPVRRRLLRAQGWLPRVFGVVLLAFAIWVAVQAIRVGETNDQSNQTPTSWTR